MIPHINDYVDAPRFIWVVTEKYSVNTLIDGAFFIRIICGRPVFYDVIMIQISARNLMRKTNSEHIYLTVSSSNEF